MSARHHPAQTHLMHPGAEVACCGARARAGTLHLDPRMVTCRSCEAWRESQLGSWVLELLKFSDPLRREIAARYAGEAMRRRRAVWKAIEEVAKTKKAKFEALRETVRAAGLPDVATEDHDG